jgi:hypothetical protein
VLIEHDDGGPRLESVYLENYVQPQLEGISMFAKGVRDCRSRDDFVRLIEVHLAAAYSSDRSQYRAARVEVLGLCQSHPHLATMVLQAHRNATRLLGDTFAVAQVRGWVPKPLDTEVLASWILGQINGRVLVEQDPTRTPDELAIWDRISIGAVLATLGVCRVGESTRGRWRRRRRATA